MGASGNLGTVNLSVHTFTEIKEKITNYILKIPDHERKALTETTFYAVCEMESFDELCHYFQTKIASYCPEENGMWVGDLWVSDWADEKMPQIINNYLVVYETDQQMEYQNIPYYAINDIFENDVEIWT